MKQNDHKLAQDNLTEYCRVTLNNDNHSMKVVNIAKDINSIIIEICSK